MSAGRSVVRRKRWTVVVFMAPDSDLELYADLDLREMETSGSGEHLNVVAQVCRRRFHRSARFFIKPGSRRLVSNLRDTDVVARRRLENLLRWVTLRYPAHHYMVVLSGHAFGLQFGEGRATSLSLADLRRVFEWFSERNGRKLDMLGFDACSLSTAEVAHELRNTVDYLVASPIGIPFAGWPYGTILDRIRRHPRISPRLLGKSIVRDFADSYLPLDVSLSLVKPEPTGALLTTVDRLVAALTAAARTQSGRRRVKSAFVRAANKGPSIRPERALVDLGLLCRELNRPPHDVATQSAAGRVLEAAEGRVILHRSVPARAARQSGGLGIYAPNVAASSDWHASREFARMYGRLQFARDTTWDELVSGLRGRP